MLEISRGLCQQGHKVTILEELDSPVAQEIARSFDFFSPLFFLTDNVRRWVSLLRHDCKVAVWLHCHVPDANLGSFELCVKPRSFHVIAVSSTVARKVHLEGVPVHLVPNGINKEIWITPISNSNRKSFQHVFIATFERGGVMAARVARQLGKKLALASYYQNNQHIRNQNLPCSLSKYHLRGLLETADIFVYPLILPSGVVHHDTYACCAHECMAAGVVVVTWDVACFRDVYPADAIVLVTPLTYDGYDPYSYDPQKGYNPDLASPEALARLCDAVVALDRDPKRKEEIRACARAWAVQHTWEESLACFVNAFVT